MYYFSTSLSVRQRERYKLYIETGGYVLFADIVLFKLTFPTIYIIVVPCLIVCAVLVWRRSRTNKADTDLRDYQLLGILGCLGLSGEMLLVEYDRTAPGWIFPVAMVGIAAVIAVVKFWHLTRTSRKAPTSS